MVTGGGESVMWFGLSKTRLSPIGIDFGARRLKLLQVTLTDPPRIHAAAALDLPDEALKDPAARQAFYTEQLPKLLKRGGFQGRRVMCSLPAYQTLIQHLQVSAGDRDDLREQVASHLRARLNVDPSRMVVRHFQVGQIVADGTTRQEVICLAASRDVVMRYVTMMKQLRYDVVGMHSEPLAMLAAFDHMFRREADSERTTAFIDIGAATTKVIVAHGKQMAMAKAIHVAAAALSLSDSAGKGDDAHRDRDEPALAAEPRRSSLTTMPGMEDDGDGSDVGGVTQEHAVAAEACGPLAMINAQINAQMNAQAATTARSPSVPRPAVTPTAAPPLVVNESLQCLIEELQMSVRHHQRLFPNRTIERLVFLGGGASQTAVCQHIARTLRIGAQLGDPLARLTRDGGKTPPGVDLRQTQPAFAVPVGLCLSEPNL